MVRNRLLADMSSRPSNKHHHHGGVPLATTAAWHWQIIPPHPLDPLMKGLVGGLAKKNMWYTQQLYFMFLHYWTLCTPKMMHNPPPDAPPPSVPTSSLYCHLLIPPLFGWLLCVSLSIGGLAKPMCYLFLIIFCHLNHPLNRCNNKG